MGEAMAALQPPLKRDFDLFNEHEANTTYENPLD
jgi:hypothetical protein